MESITGFIEQNISMYLLLFIVLGGIFVVKYTKGITKVNNTYKVLIASVIFSIISYYIEKCNGDCLPKYLFTYLFATSFYELIMKTVVNKLTTFFR